MQRLLDVPFGDDEGLGQAAPKVFDRAFTHFDQQHPRSRLVDDPASSALHRIGCHMRRLGRQARHNPARKGLGHKVPDPSKRNGNDRDFARDSIRFWIAVDRAMSRFAPSSAASFARRRAAMPVIAAQAIEVPLRIA